METSSELVPLLVVREAADAIDFYVRALGATVLARYEHGAARHVSHAELAVSDARFAVTEEARAWNSDAPPSLGGSPVVLQLMVGDADAVFSAMLGAGATIVFPLQEFLGERMARVRDPFGHLWLLRQRVEELSNDEIQRRRDELYARFAESPSAPEDVHSLSESGARAQPRIHLVIGPVGAGKSTYALALALEESAVRFALDEWMTRLFSGDRPDHGVVPWYVERAERCTEQIWSSARAVVERGTNVILELGLLQRLARRRFYERIAEAGLDFTVHVLDALREIRRERVEERNRSRGETFSMVVPPDIFELASDLWEPLETSEWAGRDVRFVRTDE